MTSNYDEFSENISSLGDLEDSGFDYFELLSAYIDGEATVEECKQVQQWLDDDPEIKQTYLQLMKLQTQMQSLTVPPQATVPAEVLAEQVFAKIDRNYSRRRVVIWGSAIAATIVATVSSLVPNVSTPGLRFTEQPRQAQPLMVAVSLNKPTVVIPKAAVSTTTTTNNPN